MPASFTVFPTCVGIIDLLGYSMGGNLVMIYAGLRPARIWRLINLEGFGMPQTKPHQALKRLLQWLDELKDTEQINAVGTLLADLSESTEQLRGYL